MTEVVGSGTKSAEDMTRAQAGEAMRRIFDGDPHPTTLGAFWLANRWKHNTPAELAAFTDEMCDRAEYVAPDADPDDGKGRTAILGVAAGVVAAGAGTPVVTHSGDRTPTQKQDAYKHVLDALGVATELTPRDSADMVDETNFGFYYQPAFNPAVADLFDARDRMGVRTFVNTVETLANPAGASVHLGSFYHLAFAKKVVETFAASEFHDPDRVVMFQGLEGYDDIRPGYTKVADWSADGDFDDYEIETAAYGMDFEEEDLQVDDVAEDSARLTREVVAGDRTDHWYDAVALNAAVRIYARGDADSLDAGLDAAHAAIDDGSAAAVLDDLRAF